MSAAMTSINSRSKLTVVGMAAVLFFATASARAADIAIKIESFTFVPQQLKVKSGTTVTWTNGDDIPHTVVSPNNFRSKALDTNDNFSFTFTTPGSYTYFCSLHPHMTGIVVVEATTGSVPSQ
jgi:plastocyanin